MQSDRLSSPNMSSRQVVRKPAVRSTGGIVVSHNRLASEIGARVLAAGGHAVDAAVATSFAVGVLEPWMSGVGAAGLMLVRSAAENSVVAVDFGGRAPMALDPADYPIIEGSGGDLFGWPRVKDDRNLHGASAAVVPTVVAGVARAHRQFGRKPWRELVEPAVALAQDGPVVDWHTTLMIARAFAELAKDEACRRIFLPQGVPPAPAIVPDPAAQARLPNPALARTLTAIAAEGPEAFYRGAIARDLLRDLRRAGGVHAEEDFAAASEVRMVAPRTGACGDHTIHVGPEFNGGPTLLDALDAARQGWPDLGRRAHLDAQAFTAIAAGLQSAWARRFSNMGDATQLARGASTTHINVVDRDGNMVALTQTLLSLFGAHFMSPSTGILLNNGINWFDPRPGGPNALAGGRRALANYCPAIMTGPESAFAVGGAGGRKIMPAVFQILIMLAGGMSVEDAIHDPRIDVSGGEAVVADRNLARGIRDALTQRSKVTEAERSVYPYHFAITSAVRRQGTTNEASTEPYQPWSEAVSEEEV